MSERLTGLKHWLQSLGYLDYDLSVASEDASFRRYFRLSQGEESWIVMDAPPEKEPCDAFVKVANLLLSAGLNAPKIIDENHHQGFLLLTDFGDTPYLDVLQNDTVEDLHADATAVIQQMQSSINADGLPSYDEALLRREMGLFKQWFLEELLGISLNPTQLGVWQMTVDNLVKSALEQPQVFVHRDFHSRNLMHLATDNPGIIDFQDAVKGPVTYDLVSLLRDCYIDWPEDRVDQWVIDFLAHSSLAELNGVDKSQFMHWFNLMGVQRHLKAIGIFSRLKLRDGKHKFLQDIPRTLNYLNIVGSQDRSMVGLYSMINELSLGFRVKALLR